MFTINNYVIAESLEQAYELNQNRRNVILGGNLWLKMSRKAINKAIDLSTLGLNNIEETDDEFKIGCMCTLRDLEIHEKLNSYFDGVISKSVNNIVGVQLRNGATIGGTIFSRFGFSDVLTALLTLDTYVELYKGGIIPLSDFVDMPLDNDILVNIIIKKDNRKVSYLSHRMSSSDLPVLTCAVSNINNEWNVVIGARPMKAKLTKLKSSSNLTEDEINNFVKNINDSVKYGSNFRGSKEYRQILAEVFIKRNIQKIVNV
jgi:CO/xanthine dehydrogenase FAD-binding subunit